jgi:hypothetical protein
LPIEALIPVEPPPESSEDINLQDSILHRAYELIDKLPQWQENARNNTDKSQQKQKQYFDAKIKIQEFEVGDKVWIQRKELEMSRSAKFENK